MLTLAATSRRNMLTTTVLVSVLIALPESGSAGSDPDWPCAQPLVPSLTIGTFWNTASSPPRSNWRTDLRIAALVASITPRDAPVSEALARLSSFAESVAVGERASVFTMTFQGLVDESNTERDRLIVRIKELAHRQRRLSQAATEIAAELRDAQPDDPGTADLVQRHDVVVRSFQEVQRTIRYTCEAPANLEARLGRFARVLEAQLGS
jgi:hypothetical protein